MNEETSNTKTPKSVNRLLGDFKNILEEVKSSEEVLLKLNGIEDYESKKRNKTAAILAIGFFSILVFVIMYEGFILNTYYQDINSIKVPSGNIEILKYQNEIRKAAIIDIRYAIKDLFMVLGSIGTGIFAYYFARDMEK